jgi:hypothetical protein
MKKIVVFSLVFILLAATAVPVLAGNGGNNGHGNGASANHGNGNGNGNGHDQNTNRDQGRGNSQNQGKGKGENGNGKYKNQENKGMFTPFYLQVTITAIDSGAKTITVHVYHANAKVKQFLGGDLVVAANDSTQIFQITQGEEITGTETSTTSSSPTTQDENDEGEPANRIPIKFDKLTVGEKVAIHGTLLDTVYTARLITAYITEQNGEPEEPSQPVPQPTSAPTEQNP